MDFLSSVKKLKKSPAGIGIDTTKNKLSHQAPMEHEWRVKNYVLKLYLDKLIIHIPLFNGFHNNNNPLYINNGHLDKFKTSHKSLNQEKKFQYRI